jgi:RHS repeat-associated protein
MYVYDDIDRLIEANSQMYGGNMVYQYDKIGNMLYNCRKGYYEYDSDHPHAVKRIKINGETVESYNYDPNGNMYAGGNRDLIYDYDNRPTTITSGGNTVDSVYDAFGSRVTKTVAGQGMTKYIGQMYECTGGVCTKYIFAGTKRIAQVKGADTYYYHTDHLESSTVITDQDGNKVEELLYYPFGERLSDTGSANVKYKYAGHEFDSETELIYMGARYYDPKLARFISADTIVPLPFYPQSLNRFSYTYNNPIVLRELDGHDSTGVAQFTSPSSPSYYSPSAPTNPSAIGTATNNALPPAPVGESAGATTDNDGTQEGGGGDTGGNSKNIPQVNPNQNNNQAAKDLQVNCEGQARVLEGNTDLIGKEGAFKDVPVTKDSAAIIPEQFGLNKSDLKPYADQIKGSVDGKDLFNGVTDVIGGKSPIPNVNVRTALQTLNPGSFIVEVVGSRDLGTVNINLTVPANLNCPTGTKRK